MLAIFLSALLAGAAFVSVFFFAYRHEGDRVDPDPYAIAFSVLAALAAAALLIAIAWLGRLALTGSKARPGWRLSVITLAVPVLLTLLLGIR